MSDKSERSCVPNLPNLAGGSWKFAMNVISQGEGAGGTGVG